MTDKKQARGVVSDSQWAAQIAALDEKPAATRREPLTAGRIVDAALRLTEAHGFDAVTMRRLAGELGATQGALYSHVRDKGELDDLMVGELCSQVALPEPDAERWMDQALDVCRQLRDQYLRYPGVWRATVASAPHSLETLRINEALLAVLMAGGASVRSAAWAADAAFLYIGAYSVVAPRRTTEPGPDGTPAARDQVVERLKMLPPDLFPITVSSAEELNSGEGHDRFDHTLRLLFGGLPGSDGDGTGPLTVSDDAPPVQAP
ncbi:TetR/AcrR family transcriptional regulator [Streptomyces sp. ITFR-16]|uniref:TetR/AcrR family transcriptional regulator n=1 Tax=Streptomyces sp. ITFR-16 TaxID=3075198 RepID=UPI00288AD51D|nr:TetR/AcrR family transcriptional regulator [Streptomyces sp. ITFR-16]WNI20829.1 TetR/AcrR family transcriptional regulator [Streptomyces sp. ITFR-16]